MKIVHILLGKPRPTAMVGPSKVIHKIATKQLEVGQDVEVWGITKTPDMIEHTPKYVIRLFKAPWIRFWPIPGMQEAVRSLPICAVVHFHSVFIPEYFTVSRMLLRRGIPWIVSPHGGYSPEGLKRNWLMKKIYTFFFESHLLAEAAAIHAVGISEITDVRRIAMVRRVVLIPNGQDLDDVAEIEAGEGDVPKIRKDDRPAFGFCGRLATRHKGLDLLIDGFAKYRTNGGKGTLWLVGDGKDRSRLHNQVKQAGLGSSVRFCGALHGAAKFKYLEQLDVFVHTSRWEGLPIAVLEAASLSKPLLVSRETNLGDYVDRHGAGLVLTANTPTQIAEAMCRMSVMFDEGVLNAIGKGALQMIREDLNWDSASKKLLALYETIISEGVG